MTDATRRAAVVTGAAGQVGREVVALLEQHDHAVVGLDLAAACPPDDERYHPCDVTSEESTSRAFEEAAQRLGGIDLLVLAAGLSATGALTDHPLSAHRQVMEVTHLGAVNCLFAALPSLRRNGGRVVLVGSVAGFAPVLGRPAYVAAKHAVTGLFEAVRPELAAMGVGLTVVHPTFIAGGMSEVGGRRGSARLTTGAELTPVQVAQAIVEGSLAGRRRVLVGRTAHLAWQLSRHTPRVYETLMVRRLRAEGGHR